MSFLSIKKISNGLMRRFLGTQIIKVHYLGRKIVPQTTDVDDLVKPLEYNDFLLGDKEEFTAEKLEIVKKRLDDNTYKAYGIIEDNKLIYSGWISLEKIGLPVILKDEIHLNEYQGYLEDAFCSLNSRGKGIHSKMISYRLSRLFELGKKEAIVTVIEGNTPSLKAEMKNGMKDLGVFYCGKILWRPFCTLSKKKKLFDTKI